MLTDSAIESYVNSIPPLPKIVRECSELLGKGDLVAAANKASEDRALIQYLQNIVNKPIFGFRSNVKDPNQIFGILGLSKAKQILHGYYLLLILPKQWKVFDFNSSLFQEFQARLIHYWGKIIDNLEKESEELNQAISIIPASLIVCEMLFRDIKDTIMLLKEKKDLSYEEILYKMTGKRFLDIASFIAQKWDFSQNTINLIKEIDKKDEDCSLDICFLKLLLAYEMSRPMMIKSGLSDLFDITLPKDEYVVEKFYKIIQSEE
jgi:HD-like signal output (HDOD) protein